MIINKYLSIISHNSRLLSSNSSIKSWLNNFKGGSVYLNSFDNDISNLIIDNPESHNSLTGEMMSQMDDCVQVLEKKPPKGLIISSKSGSFCSGGNLKFVEQIANCKDGDKMCQFMQAVTRRIEKLPSLSIALVEGVAYGGGAELTLCCDFRFISSIGKISFKQRNLGVTTGWGGCPRLIQLIGKQEALKYLLSTEVINANKALEIGLVDRILESNNPEERLRETINNLKSIIDEVPENVLFAIKTLVWEISNLNIDCALNIERNVFKTVWGNKDHLEALKKFLRQ